MTRLVRVIKNGYLRLIETWQMNESTYRYIYTFRVPCVTIGLAERVLSNRKDDVRPGSAEGMVLQISVLQWPDSQSQ